MTDENKHFSITTSTWSNTIEKVIKNIGESCEGYKWMNIFAARKASYRYNLMMYILIFIGPISGILSTLSTTLNNDDSKKIQILVTIFSFLSGVISTIIKFSKYEQKTASHKSIAAKYASLEGNVHRQLSLYRNERVNAGEYLEWVSTSFDDLFSSTPLMPDDIYEQWVEFAKNNGLSIPKRIGTTIEIEDGNHVEQLTHVGKIDVNNSDTVPSTTTVPNIEIVVQGTDTTKRERRQRQRSTVYTTTPELNQYTDKAMEYEMRRMFGFH